MKAIHLSLGLVLSAGLFSSPVFAGAYDELSAADQGRVQNGEQVFITQDVAGAPWPRALIYQRIDATPEESGAVFGDYELSKNYIANLTKSQIANRIDKATVDVDYTINLPWPLSDENYTIRDHVSSYDNGASFRTDWKLVRADSTKDTVGGVRFERLGTGTIMLYVNFVTPGSSFAGMIRNKAMQQMKDTAQAIVNQVQKEHTSGRDQLSRQIQALHTALGR